MAMQGSDFARLLGLNPEVHQATGMISVQIDGSLEAAARQLLVAAEANHCSPDSIAADVISRRKRFAPQK